MEGPIWSRGKSSVLFRLDEMTININTIYLSGEVKGSGRYKSLDQSGNVTLNT